MGDDGSQGVRAVKQAGGLVIAESEETAVIFGMPQQAIRTGAVDRVLGLHEIAASILVGIGKGEKQALRAGMSPHSSTRERA
jgi:two-component system chemotaxis response regulator CheB